MYRGFWWKSRKAETTRKIYTQMGDNIKMDLRDTSFRDVVRTELAQDWVQERSCE
jgi:hypothetical protein